MLPLIANPVTALASDGGVSVGSISEVDLNEIRRVIELSDDVGTPNDAEGRTITLEGAIKIALEHNLQLQIAVLDLEAQAPEISATKAKFHPIADASALFDGTSDMDPTGGSTTREKNRFGDAKITQELPTGGQVVASTDVKKQSTDDPDSDYTAGFKIEATQPLLKGGRTYVARREILDSQYDQEILRARLRSEILNVTAGTKIAFYETILTSRLIEVTQDALSRDRELIDASKALFSAGRVNKRDVFSAEIKLAEDKARLARDEREFELAENQLRDVLGLPIDMKIGIAQREIPFDPVGIELEDWIRSAIANRPEILEIRTELEKSDLDIRVRQNDVLPSLDLVGSYARTQTGASTSKAYGLDDSTWTAGLNFSIPFGNVAARSRLIQAKTARARLERLYVALERSIELQVRSFEIALRRALEELLALTEEVEQARAKLEIANVRFQLGLANNLDITDADTDLTESESDLLTAITDYASNLARIEAAIVRPI